LRHKVFFLEGGSILLLDEVTSGLDPDSIAAVVRILVTVRDKYNVTIIATLHQIQYEDVKDWDRFFIMSHGTLIGKGRVGGNENEMLTKLRSTISNELISECKIDDLYLSEYEEMVVLASLITATQCIELKGVDSDTYDNLHTAVPGYEPALRKTLPLYTQIYLLFKRGFLLELRRVNHVVDLLQLCFEMGVQLLFYKGLLSKRDGPSGTFYDHIGPLYTMNIACAYRGAFTALYGEYRTYKTTRNHILTKLYSRSAYIIYHLITTFIVGLIWPIMYYTLAMWIQGAPWNNGAIISGLIGIVLTYLCGQLVGVFSAMVTTTFVKGISLMVVLNWFQLMPSGSFHNADIVPGNMRWLSYISYLYFTTAATIYGVTDIAVEYTCNGSICEEDEIYWGPSTLGYNMSYSEYVLYSLLWYLGGLIIVVVAFYTSKRYRPKRFKGVMSSLFS